jgi:hypothetical protein
MLIEITTDEKLLSRNVWTFYVNSAVSVMLERYVEETRPSTRHEWTPAKRWPVRRDQSGTQPCRCPSVPPELEAELRKRIADAVCFDWNAA